MTKPNKATDQSKNNTSATSHSAIHPPSLLPNSQPIGVQSTSGGASSTSLPNRLDEREMFLPANAHGNILPLIGGPLSGHLDPSSIMLPVNAPPPLPVPHGSILASEILRHMASPPFPAMQNAAFVELAAQQMSGISPTSLRRTAQLPFLHGGANFPLAIGAPGMFQGIGSSGHQSMLVYMEQDEHALSSYQCLVRKQIEIFEATASDIGSTAQGRNRPICLKQVGIRCRHCGQLPIERRARGAVYYPSQLAGLYQTAQNMANAHLIKDCVEIPKHIREDLIRIRLREKGASTQKSAYGGGRHYWADCLRRLGVVETPDRRLCFAATPLFLYNSHAGLSGIV